MSDTEADGDVTVSVAFEGELLLEVNEIWPDGDAPEVITAEAVKAAMEASGSKFQVLRDWCLSPDVVAIVDDKNSTPRRLESEEVWR